MSAVGRASGRLAELDRTVPHVHSQDSNPSARPEGVGRVQSVFAVRKRRPVLHWLEVIELERRKHPRIRILVDLEMAVGEHGVAHGVAENLSREGVSLHLEEGSAPEPDRVVILNFKVWTGRERLTRSLNARVVRVEDREVGLAFLDQDPMTAAAVQDLLFYAQFDQRYKTGNPHAA